MTSVTSVRRFHENHPKAEYHKPLTDDVPYIEQVKKGFKILKQECKLWTKETYEKLEDDPAFVFNPGDHEIIWKFDNQDTIDKFIVTTDRDNNEGFSEASWNMSKHGKGMFCGNLSMRVPKEGQTKITGYCNIRSIRAQKSFKRDSFHDWSLFTHLLLRVRGDGRPYLLNLATSGYFDVTWNDVYQYVLYTRGGPYWQLTLIPFSKFFLSSKGRVQDRQYSIPQSHITHVGITCLDRNDGPFQLEVDYIGVYFDANHREEFAYEMYKLPGGIVGSS